ncbi:MAG TPA: replication protein [Bacteroidales bacterium]|nr:replication protein [Bacteroidales bacterium]
MDNGTGIQGGVSPQAENGHIDIANEIAEALMRTNLSSYQSRILWAIWRKTYGWHKKEDWISNKQFVELTGLRKQHVNRTLKELKERNIVTNSGYKIAFNKTYTQWRELPKQVTVTSTGNKVTNSGYKVTCTGAHKRNLTKETITKENIYTPLYEHWNSLKIIIHKKLTEKQKTKIRAAIKDYTKEEIIKAMDNYAYVVNSSGHYFSHKWPMEDFLQRGLSKFVDEATPLTNFTDMNGMTKADLRIGLKILGEEDE